MTMNVSKFFFFLAEDCSLIMQQHALPLKSFSQTSLHLSLHGFMNKPKKDANLLNNSHKYYQQALCEFSSEIQDVLMKDQAVYFITQQRNRCREILAEEGLDNAFSHRSDRLQRRLFDYFGSSIQIVSQRGKLNLVCSSAFAVSEMCSWASKLQKEINEFLLLVPDNDNTDDTLVFIPQNDPYRIPKQMRQKLKDKANAQKPKNTGKNWSKPYQNHMLEMWWSVVGFSEKPAENHHFS